MTAIWLAENQATGYIKLQEDFDEKLQTQILTCFLLPQQNSQTKSMVNLALQGSAHTDILSSHNTTADGTLPNKQAESVRFAPDSDDEEKIV